MHGGRFGRGNPSYERDKQMSQFPANDRAATTDEFAPMQIQGSQVFRRPATSSQRKHASDEMEQLRADNRRKDELIQALKKEMQVREERSKTREEKIKAELDQKVVAAKQKAEQDHAELQKDLEVSKSLREDLRIKNNTLKAENREQRKALSDYHVLYSLKKVYDTHHKTLSWHKQLQAERLYSKYKNADTDAMKAAYDLYAYLEDNGLERTLKLDPDLKKSLKWLVSKTERPSR